jgi:hypothetical protein
MRHCQPNQLVATNRTSSRWEIMLRTSDWQAGGQLSQNRVGTERIVRIAGSLGCAAFLEPLVG